MWSVCNSTCLNCARAIPQIQEQFVKSVQVIPRELFQERIEEQIVDILVPPIAEETAEVVQTISIPGTCTYGNGLPRVACKYWAQVHDQC